MDPKKLDLVFYPNPCLRGYAKTVTDFNEELSSFVDRMKEVMLQHGGIGLSAPQIGLNLRLCIVREPIGIDDMIGDHVFSDEPIVLVNPSVSAWLGDMNKAMEGCLSLPGFAAEVTRHGKIEMIHYDLEGNRHKKIYTGIMARILLHEFDHLNGRMIHNYVKNMTVSQQSVLDNLARNSRNEDI